METYTFTNQDGNTEQVNKERWGWGVVYKPTREQLETAIAENRPPVRDELHQFSPDGTFHQFSEVEQDRIDIFVVYQVDNPNHRIDIVKQDGEAFFAKYRNVKRFYMQDFVRVYMFGIKRADGTYQNHFILPDNRIVISSKDNVDLVNFELNRPQA